MSGLFLTGASGFVGRAMLEHLPDDGRPVTVLTRRPDALQQAVPARSGWTYLAGDLDTDDYAAHIPPGATVMHLAAVTGKARPAEYRRVIVDGTVRLLRHAEAAEAGRFLFVSSIAAAFPDLRHYPYGRAKADAESKVRASRLPWLIVRPTMVFGPGSPVLTGLATLAGGPVLLLPGPGTVTVQPVDRDDLARALLALTGSDAVETTIEIGGPDRLTMRDLLEDIRAVLRDGARGPVVRLPLSAMRHGLGLVEPALLPVMPLTAGQLASFANPGVARPSPHLQELGPWRSLAEMLEDLRP